VVVQSCDLAPQVVQAIERDGFVVVVDDAQFRWSRMSRSWVRTSWMATIVMLFLVL